MKVKELINRLRKENQNAEVMIKVSEDMVDDVVEVSSTIENDIVVIMTEVDND